MRLLQFSACFALLASCYGYVCPSTGTFYHAMVSTGCQEYHLCENSVMTTLTCPTGQAFDHHTNQCNDASLVHCEEMEHHHHHKRSAGEEEVHSVSIEVLKNAAKEVYLSVKSLVKKTLQETAPTVYDRIKTNYTPIFESIKKDFEPVVKDKIVPRMEKFYVYAKRMSKKIFTKVQKSVELSNSTHLNVVSFTDVFDELTKDMEPVLHLGRYFSARLAGPNRAKRAASTPITEVPELLLGYMEPVMKGMFASVTSMLSGNDNTLTSKVIIPIILNMTNDPETMFDLKKIFWSSKAAYAPLVYEMLKRQSIYNPDGTIISIPQEMVREARSFYYRETSPLIRKIMEKHLEFALVTISRNTELLFDAFDRMSETSQARVQLLRDSIRRFIVKHREVLLTSDSKHLNTYTFEEIKKDLLPIEVTSMQLFMDYLSKMDSNLVRFFFSQGSFFRALLPAETFAVPKEENQSAFTTESDMNNMIRKSRQI